MTADPVLTVREGIDVRARAEELGLDAPETYAILPFDFVEAESTSDLLVLDQAAVIRREVLAGFCVDETPLEPDEPLGRVGQSWGEHLYLPTIHFTAGLLENRWDDVVALISRLGEYYAARAEELDSVPPDATIEIGFNCAASGNGAVQFVFEDRPDRLDRVIARMVDELDVPDR